MVTNNQPRKGVIGYRNRIDIGNALAHLYVASEDAFRFFRAENAPTAPGYSHMGSVTL